MAGKNTYHNVSREEMEDALSEHGFRLLNNPQDLSKDSWPYDLREGYHGQFVKELVYGHRVQPKNRQITIRVYSGIVFDGNSRGVGEDAIRVCAVWRDIEAYETFKAERPPIVGIGSQTRVHRIKTWRKNLLDRIFDWENLLGPCCPKCGKFMAERHRKGDPSAKFWGCPGYATDECNGTLPY